MAGAVDLNTRYYEAAEKKLGLEYSEDNRRLPLIFFTPSRADIDLGVLRIIRDFRIEYSNAEASNTMLGYFGIQAKEAKAVASSAKVIAEVTPVGTFSEAATEAVPLSAGDSTITTTASPSIAAAEVATAEVAAHGGAGKDKSSVADFSSKIRATMLARSGFGASHASLDEKKEHEVTIILEIKSERACSLIKIPKIDIADRVFKAGGKYVGAGVLHRSFQLELTMHSEDAAKININEFSIGINGENFGTTVASVIERAGIGLVKNASDTKSKKKVHYKIISEGCELIVGVDAGLFDNKGQKVVNDACKEFFNSIKQGRGSFSFRPTGIYSYQGLKDMSFWQEHYEKLASRIASLETHPVMIFLKAQEVAELKVIFDEIESVKQRIKSRLQVLNEPHTVVTFNKDQETLVFRELIQKVYAVLASLYHKDLIVPEMAVKMYIKMPLGKNYYLAKGEEGDSCLILSHDLMRALNLYIEKLSTVGDEHKCYICFADERGQHYLRITIVEGKFAGIAVTDKKEEANIWTLKSCAGHSHGCLNTLSDSSYELTSSLEIGGNFVAFSLSQALLSYPKARDNAYARLLSNTSTLLNAEVGFISAPADSFSYRLAQEMQILAGDAKVVDPAHGLMEVPGVSAIEHFRDKLHVMVDLLSFRLAYHWALDHSSIPLDEVSKKMRELIVFEEDDREVYHEIRGKAVIDRFDWRSFCMRDYEAVDYTTTGGVPISRVELDYCELERDTAARLDKERGRYTARIQSYGTPVVIPSRGLWRVIAKVYVKNKDNPKKKDEINKQRAEIAASLAKVTPEEHKVLMAYVEQIKKAIQEEHLLLRQIKYIIMALSFTGPTAERFIKSYDGCQALGELPVVSLEDSELGDSARAAFNISARTPSPSFSLATLFLKIRNVSSALVDYSGSFR